MRKFLFLFYVLIFFKLYSVDLGVALSLDYFNNPIEDSAPSPIQNTPALFHNFSYGFFNIKSGLRITESNYEISTIGTPAFNDMYSGFYTVEFDIFTFPGVKINLTPSLSLGLSGGGGVRLPVISKIDSDLDSEIDVDRALNWFYTEYRYIFWGAELFIHYKLLESDKFSFYGDFHYINFQFRSNEWIIGATVGLLWHII